MITALIPTYNCPDALDLCIKSAYEGQQGINEILVLVDGMADQNKHVIEKWKGKVNFLILEENIGVARILNLGVFQAKSNNILIVNDDNVFPKNWDVSLSSLDITNTVVSPNQIEPFSSMFPQFIIKDLGRDPKTFDLKSYWEFENTCSKEEVTNEGSTFPIYTSKLNWNKVGGYDEQYPSSAGYVADWDLFLKYRLNGINTFRSYTCHFYHFVSLTAKSETEIKKSQIDERNCHKFAKEKWGSYIGSGVNTNSKHLQGIKDYKETITNYKYKLNQ